MRTSLCVTLALAMLGLAAGPAAAQKADVKAEVLKDWTDMKATLVKIASEMPEDKYGVKPTPPQRSFGDQVLHAAGANANFMKALGGKATAPMINMKATGKTEIIKALEDSFDYGAAVINEQTSDSILEQVKVPPFMGGMASRARVVNFLIGHSWDVYGQLAVYLRLNGHVPPASQRP